MARRTLKDRDSNEAGEIPCPGDSCAFGAKMRGEPHPAVKPHPDCMNCHAPLGCVRCSGITRELLCMKCRNWGHKDALKEHGRLLRTDDERRDGIAFLNSILSGMK